MTNTVIEFLGRAIKSHQKLLGVNWIFRRADDQRPASTLEMCSDEFPL